MYSTRRSTATAALAAAVAVVLAASACGAPADEDGGRGTGGSEKVRMAMYGWVGYTASAAVLTYLLKNELGYEVEQVEVAEEASWRELDAGSLDVVLENWGHQDLMELYGAEENPSVVDGGTNGNTGTIGWYVPAYLVEEYPDIATAEGIKKHAEIFAGPDTGDTGRFLSSDPTFVTQDQGMINNFGMDLEIDYAGSEKKQIEEIREAYEEKEPALFYFYEPQWLFEELDLVQVEFPEYIDGCEMDPQDIGCGYPDYDLNKLFRKGFADNGGDAYELLSAWQWTNEDQNEVAKMIDDAGMSPEKAAETWVNENPETWRPWIPDGV